MRYAVLISPAPGRDINGGSQAGPLERVDDRPATQEDRGRRIDQDRRGGRVPHGRTRNWPSTRTTLASDKPGCGAATHDHG